MEKVTNTHRFFIYARKSTDSEERQVRSIPDQIAELEALAAREGCSVVKTFVESKTAKKPGRPVFNEMIQALTCGEADGILAWHPDRLARNSLDGGQIIHLLDTGVIKTLKFPIFWFDPTPQGKFMLAIAFGQSKYYVDNLSENVKRGNAHKLKNGLWPEKAPIGYLNDKTTKRVVVDLTKSDIVRGAFEFYATGKRSLSEVSDMVRELGLVSSKKKPLSVAHVQYLLRNPFYYGLMRYGGEFYEGVHDPIITKELFDRVQDALRNRRKRSRKQRKYFALRGLMVCGECGRVITAEIQKGHTYYRCTKRRTNCRQPYVREEVLEAQMAEKLERYAIPQHWAEAGVAELLREKAAAGDVVATQRQGLERQIHTIDAKIARLTEGYSEGVLSIDDLRSHKAPLVEEKQRLRAKITNPEEQNQTWFELAIDFLQTSSEAGKTASEGAIEEKRKMCEKIGSNFFVTEKRFSFAPKLEWETLVPERFLGSNGFLSAPITHTFSSASSDWSEWLAD